ncbi:MAG: NADH-quinone oxidoreductase subunit 15 [Deinococcales bacterium]
MNEKDGAFYQAWATLLQWMRDYAAEREDARFEKEADFADYIYRMERPYDLPTTVMSASLSDAGGKPVLLVNASPRKAVFKEVVLHPFESHTYRKLTLAADGQNLAEGKRVFTKERLYRLADELFGVEEEAPA